jgi:hypothetical protein
MVVGADGAPSVVHKTIFGDEKAKSSPVPYSAINLHVKYGDADKAVFVRHKHPIMTHAIHPDWLLALDLECVVLHWAFYPC